MIGAMRDDAESRDQTPGVSPWLRAILGVALVIGVWHPLVGQERPLPADSATPVEPIVVTVTRVAETASRVPYGLSVLGLRDLVRASSGTSLAGALALVPGVTAQNRFNPAQDERISIRGFGARAAFGIRGVRILLDGIPQTLPDGQGQLTNIDLRRISRIEVLRGVSSSLYGNASDPLARADLEPEARVFYGTDDLFVTDAGLTVPLESGWLAVRGSRTRGDGFRTQSRFETWRGSVRASLHVGARTQVLAAVHLSDTPRAEDPGGLNADELAADPAQAHPGHVSVDAHKDVSQGQVGITVRHAMRGGGRVNATIFGLRRDLFNQLTFARIDLERWAYGARAVASFPLPVDVPAEVSVGADVQWQRDDRRNTEPDGSAVTRDQLETVREFGPFVQFRLQPVSRVALTLGGRFDDVQFQAADRLIADGDQSGVRSMSALSGTAGLAVEAHPALTAYASVGNGFEAPTTTELANQADGSDGFNRDLDPQRATQFEVGIRGKRGPVSYDVAVFQANVTGALIPFEVPSVPDRTFFRNAGKTRHRGIEVSARAQPVSAVWLTAAYTFMDLEFIDFVTESGALDGNTIPGVPRHFFSGALRVQRGPVRLQADVRVSSLVFVNDANATKTDGWFVADVRVDAEVTAGGFRVVPYAGAENLFDERYVGAVRVNAGFGRFYEPAAGRRVFVGVELAGGDGR